MCLSRVVQGPKDRQKSFERPWHLARRHVTLRHFLRILIPPPPHGLVGVVALPSRLAQGPGRPPFTLTAWPLRRQPLWIGVRSSTDAPRERPGSTGMERTVGACWPLAPAVPTPLATAPVHGRAAWRLPGLRESWSESPPGRPHLMPPSTSHPSNPGVSSPKEASTRRSPNLRGAPPSVHPPPPPPASPPSIHRESLSRPSLSHTHICAAAAPPHVHVAAGPRQASLSFAGPTAAFAAVVASLRNGPSTFLPSCLAGELAPRPIRSTSPVASSATPGPCIVCALVLFSRAFAPPARSSSPQSRLTYCRRFASLIPRAPGVDLVVAAVLAAAAVALCSRRTRRDSNARTRNPQATSHRRPQTTAMAPPSTRSLPSRTNPLMVEDIPECRLPTLLRGRVGSRVRAR